MLQAHSLEEVEDFIGIAHCLLVNMGTLDPDWLASMLLCATKCVELKKPWVLDPVGAGPHCPRILPYRRTAKYCSSWTYLLGVGDVFVWYLGTAVLVV